MSLETPTQQDLEKALRAELVKQQDVLYGIVGGLAAAIVGAVIWATVTVLTKYQIGYMAIGVGLMVGLAVRFFGAGIDKYFGIIGAVFALLGCLLGNLLSQVGFVANEESLSYFDVIGRLNFNLIGTLFKETFSPMDVVFYLIAAYEGFRFGFRNIEDELNNAVAAGKVEPPPFAKFRLPVVIGLFVALSVLGYVVSTADGGVRNFKYESGMLQASGKLINEKENGPWQFWWENGQKQATGSYINGNADGDWIYYNEDGIPTMKGLMKNGLKEGEWIQYHANGKEASKGQYALGRQRSMGILV